MRKSEGTPSGGKRRKLRRGMGILLAAVLVFNTLSLGELEASASETQEASPVCETGSGGVSGGDHVEDTGLCAHHQEHTENCGYGEEGSCAYECSLCPIEDLTAALPRTVTEDNGSEVRAQLDKILSLYRELTEDEQEQIDISRCLELQAALDETNVSTPIDEPTEGTVAKVETSDGTIVYLSESDFINVFDDRKYNNVTVTLLSDIQPGSIDMGGIQARVHVFNTCTLDLAGHTITGSDTAIYVWPTSNLIIKDSSSSKTGQVVSTGGAAILTQTGMVSLIGGTYTGNPAIDGKDSSTNVSSLLANYGTQTTPHYVYFDTQGNPIVLEENQRELYGTVTVQECPNHVYQEQSYSHEPGEFTHTQTCVICGAVEEVDCEYTEWGETYNIKVCACGATLTASLTGADNLVYNGARQTPGATFMVDGVTPRDVANVKTYTYNKDAGTGTLAIIDAHGVFWGMLRLDFTIAKATPVVTWNGGNTQMLTYTGQEAAVTADVKLVNDETGTVSYSYAEQGSDRYISGLPTDVGTYSVKASFAEEKNYVAAEAELTLTIAPLAITVTPDSGQHKEYGTDDPELTYTITPSLIGDDKLSGALTYRNNEAGAIGKYEIIQGTLAASSNYELTVASGVMFEITRRSLEKATVTISGTFTYDGTPQIPKADQVKVVLNGVEIPSSQYTISTSGNINAGTTATVTVTATENSDYIGSASGEFTIAKAPLTITAGDQTITYGQSIITYPMSGGLVKCDKLCNGDKLDICTLTPSTINVPGGTIIPSAAVIKNSSGEDVTGNYVITYQDGVLTINRAEGTLTVPETSISKNFGDGEFSLNCSTNGDGAISYVVSDSRDVTGASTDTPIITVSQDGKVQIRGAGSAKITVSLGEGANYTGAASQTVQIVVAKAAAPTIINETRNYTYTTGSKGAVTIDVAEKLPDDRGETEYAVATTDDNGILSNVSVDENGKLIYTVDGNKSIGDTAEVTVMARMANYESADFTVKIELTAKKTVELQPGSSISVNGGNVPTYGLSLSDLTWDSAVFVELGTDAVVEGTLAWKDGSIIPEAGTMEVEWIFTPEDNGEYIELTGTVKITVAKAKPETEIPEAEAITYNPSMTLDGVGLKGGSAAWTVGGSGVSVAGTWSWLNAGTVPTVDNSGYTAVFTPADTKNYETVTGTVSVTVAKAVPYIAVLPTVAGITYGDTLSVSALSSGTIQYGNGAGQAGSGTDSERAVAGIFTWKEPDLKPAVADSDKTEYTVIFTPFDATNYEAAECKVTLTVQKAENAPNMPGNAMTAATGIQLTLADVSLAAYTGWEWENAQTALPSEAGEAVVAVACYIGEDKDNYENVTREITVTMVEDTHVTIIPDEENDTRVVMYAGIREIPQALADAGFDTEEKILEALSRVVLQSSGYTEGNMVTYDTELQFSADGGKTWVTATEENFPSEGLTVTIPYPEGTSQSGYEFRVVHMFTHAMNGHKPGETEAPEVTNTDEGIRFILSGLSPVTIAWKAVGAASDTPGTGNDGDDNPGTTDPGNEEPSTTDPGNEEPSTTDPGNEEPSTTDPGNEEPGTAGTGNANPGTTDNNSVNAGTVNQQTDSVYAPKTGDDRQLWLCILLLIASGAGTAAAVMAAKKKKTLHVGRRLL